MTNSIHEHTDTFLGRFPLRPVRNLKFAGLKCFMAIWRKCNIAHTLENITVNTTDRHILGLSERSYFRGLQELERAGLITVEKAPGRCHRIFINLEKIDERTISFVRSGKPRKLRVEP